MADNNDVEIDLTEGTDDLEIEVVDDTPESDRGRKPLDKDVDDPSDAELAAYSDGVKKRIKELTHARHDERRAKEAVLREKQETERMAQVLFEENQRLRQQYAAGAQEYVKTVGTAISMELDNARKKLKEAHESFDTDAIIAAQEELADVKLRMQQAKNIQVPALQPQQHVVQQQQFQPQAPQVDDKTLRWQAQNQWFGAPGKESMTSYALGLHQELVNSGIDPRSDKYFEQIDTKLRNTFPDFFGETKGGSRKSTTVVAPGSRVTGAKKVQLTPTALALAKKYGLTPQQYAAEVLKLEQRNG